MRTGHIPLILAGLSLSAGLAACGTPAPAPNNNSGTHSGSSKNNASKNNQNTTKSGTSNTHPGSTKSNANKSALGSGASKTQSSTNPTGTAHGMAPISLKTLPKMTAVAAFNPHMSAYHEVSTFINEMGYHWATPRPGIVFMTNQHNQVTAVETQFPQNMGSYSWYDPATPPTILNGSLAWRTEHLYFVPPKSITPSMSATMPTHLGSWSSFVTNNPRLKAYHKEGTYQGYTVYAPPTGPAIKVLVSSSGLVSGFVVAEPASWGKSPLYISQNGQPFADKTYGKAYYSVLMLEPPKAGTKT